MFITTEAFNIISAPTCKGIAVMHTAAAVQWDRFSGKGEKREGKWPEKGFFM